MKLLALVILGSFGLHQVVWAEGSEQKIENLDQEVQRLQQLVEQLQTTVQAQSRRLAELEAARPPLPPSTPTTSQVGALQRQAVGSLAAFNPEIGFAAEIVGTLSEQGTDSEGSDRIRLKTAELVLGHYVDPYSRLDALIEFSDDEAPDVEEVYLTHWGLPAGLTGYVGRFRPKIGKAAAIDADSLETVDEPLVVDRYFGKEGYFRTGAQLVRSFELPWGLSAELSSGLLEGGVGEGGTTFGSTRRRPTLFSHAKLYKDLTESAGLELGTTHLVGSKDADARFEVNVVGFDATYIHYLTPWRRLKLQSELYLQDRDESFTIEGDARTNFRENPFGFYGLADLRLTPRWSVGGRVDYVELVDNPLSNPREADAAYSSSLTFHQSEFARWRLQYRHIDFARGGNDDAVMLQGVFAIGVHKHKLQ